MMAEDGNTKTRKPYPKRQYTDWATWDPVIEERLRAGRTAAEIAAELGIKPDTLRAHLRNRGATASSPDEDPRREERSEAPEVLPGQMSLEEEDTVPAAEPTTELSAVADMNPVMGELTLVEVQTLERCEAIIAQGIKTFVEVGHALLLIRDQRLYRQGYESFEDYLRQRWDLSRPYAYQLMDASQVVQHVSANADIVPTNESQARPLASLPPEQQVEVWTEVVKTAPPTGITGKHVQAIVTKAKAAGKGKFGKSSTPTPRTPEPQPKPMQARAIAWYDRLIAQWADVREQVTAFAKDGGVETYMSYLDHVKQGAFRSCAEGTARMLLEVVEHYDKRSGGGLINVTPRDDQGRGAGGISAPTG